MTCLESVLHNFARIASHPRPSGHEEAVAADLAAWGREQGFEVRVDSGCNVVIDAPATPGCEDAPRTILQGHTDMVCVAADGKSFDPLRDVPVIVREGDNLRADGTSLGADDGLGLAIAMTLMTDPGLRHGPLRFLATSDEEGGAQPIGPLDPAALEGRYLINLDSEDMDILTNSCAGSQTLVYTVRAPRIPSPYACALRITLRGFLGGHSGSDIHKERANSLILLGRFLAKLKEFALADFSSGTAMNAIPTGAAALITVPDRAAAEAAFDLFRQVMQESYPEPGAEVLMEDAALPADVLPPEVSSRAAQLIAALPCGVRTWSPDYEGLVECSCSVDLARMEGDTLTVGAMARSLNFDRLLDNAADYRALSERFGFPLEASEPGRGWPVDPDNPLERMFVEVWPLATGRTLTVLPIHAGLECAAFAELNPGLSLVSLGPTILSPHSPAETAELSCIEPLTRAVAMVIGRIADERA